MGHGYRARVPVNFNTENMLCVEFHLSIVALVLFIVLVDQNYTHKIGKKEKRSARDKCFV